MCQDCESKFNHMSEHFEEVMADIRQEIADDQVGDTPAQRVNCWAEEFARSASHPVGRVQTAFYLAICIERLTAMEAAGIPT